MNPNDAFFFALDNATAEQLALVSQEVQKYIRSRPSSPPVEVVGPVVFNLKACERIDIRE